MKKLREVEVNLLLFVKLQKPISCKIDSTGEKKRKELRPPHFVKCLQEPTASGSLGAIDVDAALNDGVLSSFPLWGA